MRSLFQPHSPPNRIPAFLAVCALALPMFAAAQPLDRAAQGRVAVGQCYSACLDRAHRDTADLGAFTRDLIALLYDAEVLNLPLSTRLETIQNHTLLFCTLAQSYIYSLEGCHQGCVDVEAAHGVRKSSARIRFLNLLRIERQPLVDAGLWVDFRNSPTSGADFEAACTLMMADAVAESAGGTRIERSAAAIQEQAAQAHP